MIKTKKIYQLFEYGWMLMRQNPGGKSPLLQGYLLGFAGTIDITKALSAAKKATIKVKVGSGATQVKEVDFSYAEPEALTPSAAAEALNDAGFEGCKFSVDPETKRLKLAPFTETTSVPEPEPVKVAIVRLVQVYSDLAAALHFGNCRLGEGKGCYLWGSMDGDIKNVAETENWSEDKKITNESPLGNPVDFISPGKRSGTQIVVTDRLSLRETQQMINGGTWIKGDADTPEKYEPPVGSGDNRRVDVLTFTKLYSSQSNSPGSEVYVREKHYVGGVGKMIPSGGSGNWKDNEYTLTFTNFTDGKGKERASPLESDYTVAQWDAVNTEDIVEPDWENVDA